MATYPTHGYLPQYAKYIGEFVPSDDNVEYFYRVIAYNRSRIAVTDTTGPIVHAWGPVVLDGDHAISINWTTVIGASFYIVFKAAAGSGSPPSTEQPSSNIWYLASASETEILDVGYPCATRNSFLNPGKSPIFKTGCCGPGVVEQDTNVPPVGMAPPTSTHEGGGFVRMEKDTDVPLAKPGGEDGEVQFNDRGKFGGAKVFWDKEHGRLGVKVKDPKYDLDVDGKDDGHGED